MLRCAWCSDDPDYIRYHDEEWGRPTHDDVRLFEMLILEGMQAGLSWLTVLKKRENFRRAFDGFDPTIVAKYGEDDVARLIADKGIIRNRRKIAAAIGNARCFLEIQSEFSSFDAFIWSRVGGTPIVNMPACAAEVPRYTPLAREISMELQRRGFKFVGETIIYSFMQAVGMVNDHEAQCFLAGRNFT